MRIDRCYCYKKSFALLKRIAKETDAKTIPALQSHVAFGHQCKLCHPYIACMLRDGQTVFNKIIVSDVPDYEPDVDG